MPSPEELAGIAAQNGNAALDSAEDVARELPHRERVLRINHRLARRILDAHSAWLDEAEAELRDAAARRR